MIICPICDAICLDNSLGLGHHLDVKHAGAVKGEWRCTCGLRWLHLEDLNTHLDQLVDKAEHFSGARLAYFFNVE